jgi:predicted alpha/beta hydrolase
MDSEVVKRVTANMVCDVPGGVARQFARWVRLGTFDTYDGSFCYRTPLKEVRTPFLLIAGSHDLIAPPGAVRMAEEFLGGEVTSVVIGKETGFSDDYGHGDLILGRRAPEEVFPLIEEYLAAQSTPV